MLEFDGQALDPAIVLAQPMKPAQSVDLQQMSCGSSECRIFYLQSQFITHISINKGAVYKR